MLSSILASVTQNGRQWAHFGTGVGELPQMEQRHVPRRTWRKNNTLVGDLPY